MFDYNFDSLAKSNSDILNGISITVTSGKDISTTTGDVTGNIVVTIDGSDDIIDYEVRLVKND